MKYAKMHLIAGMVFLGFALKFAIYPIHHDQRKPGIEQSYYPHICSDSTHLRCDGECICDGMECPK